MDARRIAEWLRGTGSRAIEQHGGGMPMPVTHLLAAAAILALAACVPVTPADLNTRNWPAHDGVRCVEVPDTQCQEMADQADLPGMAAAEPVRGITVVCAHPQGCSEEVGAGETFVHHTDGSSSAYGWGYGTADGPPPAPPPGLGQPRSPAEIECVRLPQAVCDGLVDDVYLEIAPGAAQPTEIHVACAQGTVCTEGAAEGTTTVVYPDGRVQQSNWSRAGAEAPPGAP